jgi:hypothetical protein
MELLRKTINWVRVVNPCQPITAAPWNWHMDGEFSALDNYMFAHSDVISFHCYEQKEDLEKRIESIKKFKRPILCTEYMARPFKSTFQDVMPLLKKHNIGAYNWGFVAGKTQTHCPWDSWETQYDREPELWFHDIYYSNGTAYNETEIEFIKEITKKEIDKYRKVA